MADVIGQHGAHSAGLAFVPMSKQGPTPLLMQRPSVQGTSSTSAGSGTAAFIAMAATSAGLRIRSLRVSPSVSARGRHCLAAMEGKREAGTVLDMEEKQSEGELEGSPAVVSTTSAGGSATVASPDWLRAARRMWTAADAYHIHAVTGVFHGVVGLFYLLDVVAVNAATLMGSSWSPLVPFELVVASIVVGAINAVTGLQPALLPRPFKDLMQLFGFGEQGNLKSAGFINTAFFYFFLTYQSIRPLESYPTWLQPLDGLFAGFTITALWHAIFIMNSWVGRGKMSQALAVAISLPLLLNMPVSLHLLFEGQGWVEQLSAAYPGWPQVFFTANYALAWSGSMVTFVLSLYERRVVSIEERNLLTVFLGALTFTVIPAQAFVLIPQWFNGDQMVMLTLIPPSP